MLLKHGWLRFLIDKLFMSKLTYWIITAFCLISTIAIGMFIIHWSFNAKV